MPNNLPEEKDSVLHRYDIILFDGACNLCTNVVRYIIKFDKRRRFKFAARESDAGSMLIEEIDTEIRRENTVILLSGKKVLIKSDAIAGICRQLDGLPRIIAVIGIVPRPVRDFIYDVIARYRYRIFGMKDKCYIPEARESERFL